MVGLGFHIAGLGHGAAAAFGVSTLLAVAPTLFTVMKLVGAAYLIRLGIKYLRGAQMLVSAPRKPPAPTARKALRDSVIVEAMNPKLALFYLALLPQFTDPTAELPIWAQIVILGMIVNAMFSVTDAILIETSHAVATRLRSSERFVLALQRLGGGVLITLGVNLALARHSMTHTPAISPGCARGKGHQAMSSAKICRRHLLALIDQSRP